MAALLTPASLQCDRLSVAGDPHLDAGAGRLDLPRVHRDGRSRRRRRRAGRHHLERRARLEQRRPADRDVEHQPRRLDGAASGHLLLAGRARRCRGPRRHAVRDHVVRLDLGRDDHADRDRHGAGRRDLRPALPVGRRSRARRATRSRSTPTSGFATGSKVFSANTSATSFAPTQTLPNNTYYWRVRGVDPQGQAGPVEQRPAVRQDLRPDRAARARRTCRSTTRSSQPVADGAHVDEPVVTWDTVPGARDYEVQTICNGSARPRLHDGEHGVDAVRATIAGSSGVPLIFSATRARASQQETAGSSTRVTPAPCSSAPSRTTRSTARRSPGRTRRTASIVGRRERSSIRRRADCDATPSCVGSSTDGDILTPHVGDDRRQEPALLLDARGHESGDVGHTVASDGYWVAIARDSNFTTHRAGGVHRRAVLRAARRRSSTRARSTTGRSSRTSGTASELVRGERGHQLAASWPRRASSTRRCRRRRCSPSAARRSPAPSLFQWTPVPEQVKNYTIEIAQDDSFSHDPRVGHHRRHRRTPPRRPTRSERRSTGACARTTTTARASRGPAPRASCRPCRCRRSRPPSRSRARRSRRSPGRRSTARRSYEVQDVWPDAQRARDLEHPEHRRQLHEDDRHGPRHGAGARGLRQRQERLHARARRRPHDRRAGRHQDLADQQAEASSR